MGMRNNEKAQGEPMEGLGLADGDDMRKKKKKKGGVGGGGATARKKGPSQQDRILSPSINDDLSDRTGKSGLTKGKKSV